MPTLLYSLLYKSQALTMNHICYLLMKKIYVYFAKLFWFHLVVFVLQFMYVYK